MQWSLACFKFIVLNDQSEGEASTGPAVLQDTWRVFLLFNQMEAIYHEMWKITNVIARKIRSIYGFSHVLQNKY